MSAPMNPKIYHIVHIDRLYSIIEDKHLWCDTGAVRRKRTGTVIGMDHIKERRLNKELKIYKDLCVGDCVPFYFCPRSIMLYVIHKNEYKTNESGLTYGGGQEAIIHLQADLRAAVDWAKKKKLRWAFTLSNAGSNYFEERKDLKDLKDINWQAVQAKNWGEVPDYKEKKQAEFLLECSFPWELVEKKG